MNIKKAVHLVIVGSVVYGLFDLSYIVGKGQMLGAMLKGLQEEGIETDVLDVLTNYKGKRSLRVKMTEGIARFFMNEKES